MKKYLNLPTVVSLTLAICATAYAAMPPYSHGLPYKPKVKDSIKRQLEAAELSVLARLGKSTKDYALGAPVPSGQLPKGMEVSPDGRYLYISDMGGTKLPDKTVRGSVTIIDIVTRAIEKVWTPNGTGEMQGNTEMLFTSDRRYALSTQFQGDLSSLRCPNDTTSKNQAIISVIDTSTKKVVVYIPTGGQGSKIMAERPKQSAGEPTLIYVANWFGDNVGVINLDEAVKTKSECGQAVPLAGKALLKKITFETKYPAQGTWWKTAPRGIGFTLDGKYAVVLGYENGTLQLVDAQRHVQLAEVPPYPMEGFNVRHIILNKTGTVAYLSHMRGDAVSRVNVAALIQEMETERNKNGGKKVFFDQGIWNRVFIPFKTKNGPVNMLSLQSYSPDHPEFADLKFIRSHPNTIVLDPLKNRYLYVSHRTTGITDSKKCKEAKTPKERLENGCDITRDLMGKVDVLDTETGEIVISFVGGISPTALTVTHDNRTLISSGYRDDLIYFYNVGAAIDLYEKQRQGR